MTEQEALEKIKQEYPEFTKDAELMMQGGEKVTELLSVLDSFY